MAQSKHMQIRDAVITRFAGIAGTTIKRGRAWPMTEKQDTLVKVYLDTSVPERAELQGQPDDNKTRIRCEFMARGTADDNAEDLADALAVQGFGLVMNDPSLAGLCLDCYPVGMAWSTDEADTSIGVCQILFEAMHRTLSNSIAAT